MERYVDGACIDILWQILTHAMSPCRLGYSGERLVTATESNKLLACSLSVNAHVTFMNLGDIYIRLHHLARQNRMMSTLSITRRCLFFFGSGDSFILHEAQNGHPSCVSILDISKYTFF